MGFLDDSIAATAKRAVVQTGPRPQPHDALRASQLSHNEPSQLSADLMQGLRVPSAPSFRISSYRLGRGRYQSLESQDVSNIVGQQVGLVDRVNAGMIVSDARKLEAVSAQIRKLGPQRIVSILEEAATVFLEGELEVGGEKMSAARYCEVQSMVTGSPVTHCARNMHKIAYVMRNLRTLLSNHLTHWRHDLGLAGLFSTLECRAKSLGAQLPSNSPGVHQLWIPFLPFVPVMLKPGSGDPFSPARIRSACVAAGLPEESISLYYSSGPEAGRVLRDVCGHFMMFGSAHAIRPYRSDPLADLHGPGYSKVVIGPDLAPEWERFLPILMEGILHNGGRSCINTSVVVAPYPYAEVIAERLALELSKFTPKPLSDPTATLAVYPSPQMARAIYLQMLDRCADGGGRMVQPLDRAPVFEGATASVLAPTVAYFPKMSAAAMKWEFLAPSVAVVNWNGEDLTENVRRTLICTPITEDRATLLSLHRAPKLSVLNTMLVPTSQIDPLKPIETNVLRFLYAFRDGLDE